MKWLLLVLLLPACDKAMTRQEQIAAIKECHDADLKVIIIKTGGTRQIIDIQCVPDGIEFQK